MEISNLATIKDIARVSGFSASTVSIVLRGQSKQRKIPQNTEETILAAARSLNYQPNLSARKLRDPAGGQYTIGIFWAADFRTIVLARVLKGLQQALMDGPHNINLVVSPYASGRLCDNKSLQGITNYNAAIIATADEIDCQHLEENPPQIPIVLYNRDSQQFSSVTADNETAGRLAASHFISKGIAHVGAVFQDHPFVATLKRRQGFIAMCEEHGISSVAENTVWSDGTVSGGFEAGVQILESGVIPQGVYCDSDATALGLQSAFAKYRHKVPDNIELATIGTAPPTLTLYGALPLTVVELPLEEMAIRSINLLVDILQHTVRPPQHIMLPPRLISRD